MRHDLVFQGNPPLTPSVTVPGYLAQMQPGLDAELARAVLEEKQGILASTPNPPWGTTSWLSSRFACYNLLNIDREEFRCLESFIRQGYTDYMSSLGIPVEPCYVRAWANSYDRTTGLVWHNHFEAIAGVNGPIWSHVSGNVSIQTYGTCTWYLSPFLGGVGHDAFGEGYDYPSDVIGVENRNGECFFFPSWIVHRTEKNQRPEPRITIAFDIITEPAYLAKTANGLFRRLI